MAEHLTEPEIELYRRREGEEAERQTTAAHLAICEHCVKRVYDREHSILAVNALTEALLSVNEEPFHLSHADLKEYVSDHAAKADRIVCESHIDICEQCREELRLLSAAQHPTRSKANSEDRLAWLRTGWWANTPVRVAAAIGLVGLIAFGVMLIRQQSSAPTPVQLAGNGSRETPMVSAPVDATRDGPAVPDSSQQSIVVHLKDNGKEIGLDHQGKLAGMEELDESTQRIVKNALAGEPLARPRVLDELSSPHIELLGEQSAGNTFQLIGPLGKIITEARPTLRWKRLNGATSYVASVFDSKFNLVTRSAPLSQLPQPAWTVAAPLQRGQNYFWEVTAVKEGKEVVVPVAPAPRAQFRILEADKLSALQNLKRQKPTSHLALGLTFARFGLVKDAEGEFWYLLKENPDSATAKRLLRTVQTWR